MQTVALNMNLLNREEFINDSVQTVALKQERSMSATIKDIAKIVGVSASTVSRALNGTAPISEEVKTKIQKAIKEVDYHPNASAKSFATGVTNTVGLVLDANNETTFSNNFFNRSVYAIEKILQENAYNLLIANDNGQNDSQIFKLVQEKKVDGLIIPSSILENRLIHFLKKEEFPFVVMGEPTEGEGTVFWVDIDNKKGALEGTKHLLKQGYCEIVLIIDDDETVFSRNRLKGYKEAVRMHCPEKVIMMCHRYETCEMKLIEEIGNLRQKGFLCSSNEIAFHVLRTLKKAGISVPNESGIVTFDNYPLAAFMDPPFTAVDVDTYQLGKKAAVMLMECIHRKSEIRHQLIKTTLICRESSAKKK